MNVKEPLLPQDVPLKAWHTLICSDLFYGENADYPLVTDYGNKFPVMKKLPNTQSSTVIAHLKSIFDEHGIPSKLVTDNGAQYTSSAFQEFSRSYGFTHVISSPFYPQSNVLIKRTVQPVKDLLEKCKESGQDPHLATFCLRSTPLSHDLPSPPELLNGQVYQINLPGISKPQFSSNGDINAKLQVRQDKQKEQYDKTAKQPPCPLFPEDHVHILDPPSGTWKPGVVQCVADAPRSYLIATEKGEVLQRNRRHLCKTGESFQCSKNEVPEDIPIANPIPVAVVQPTDYLERDTSSEFVSLSQTGGFASVPILRRSNRRVKAPERLDL